MDFTREPIIETIITPKDGCKLVIRSSKGPGHEEHFVDAVEVVSFGNAIFFRSLERPKSFLVPVADFEVVEVRETRMVLKSAAPEKSIKIGGGKEASQRAPREIEKEEVTVPSEEKIQGETEEGSSNGENGEGKGDLRLDKKRDRRRHHRKRRGVKDDSIKEDSPESLTTISTTSENGNLDQALAIPREGMEKIEHVAPVPLSPAALSSLLQPPPTLISESIAKYRENAQFKNAFFVTEEEQYKPHEKVQDLLNEEEFTPKLSEMTFVSDLDPTLESTQKVSEESQKEQPEIRKERTRKPKEKAEDAALPLFAEEFNGSIGEEELFPAPPPESKE